MPVGSGHAGPVPGETPALANGSALAEAAFDAALGLETFDSAWTRIERFYFDPGFHGLDWAEVRDELRPRAAAATGTVELRHVIQEMLDRIGRSHFALIPGEFADAFDPADADGADQPGDVGVEVRWLDGEVVVTAVDPDGPAARAGVRPGWVLASLNGRDVAGLHGAILERAPDLDARMAETRLTATVSRMLQGRAASEASLGFLDEADSPVSIDLVRRALPGEPVRIGNMPTFYARTRAESVRHPGGGRVGLIGFNVWVPPVAPPFAAAVDRFREADGIILDLRGNPGGMGGMVIGIGGHFFPEATDLGTMRTRDTELRFVTNPQRVNPSGRRVQPYAGPVAILVDGLTASTSEMFSGGLHAVGRARVFGETTAGAVLPSLVGRLPNGDVLLHAFADYVTPSGLALEGRGVPPDEAVRVRRADLLAGRDPVLEAALRWIASRAAAEL